MANELTTTAPGGAVAHYTGGADWGAEARATGGSNAKFLKFNGNTGDFTYGTEQTELPHGEQLAADMASYARGFICWVDGEVVDEEMVRVVDGPAPRKGSLTDHGPYETHADGTKDGWAEQHKVTFVHVESGEAYEFKTTSSSGVRSMGALLAAYAKEYKTHPTEAPVFELGHVTFEVKAVKRAGKKHAPVFKLVGWMPLAEVQAMLEGSADDDDAGDADDESNYEPAAAAPPAPPAPPPPPAEKAAPAAAEGTASKRGKRF